MAEKKTKKEKVDTQYLLDQIMKINESLTTALKGVTKLNEEMDIVNDNVNFACEQIEELRPVIDNIRSRMGV
tara:strand:- start:680 stop:895 length:216 start_codon:yes stop_codon:yes gene_type:complete